MEKDILEKLVASVVKRELIAIEGLTRKAIDQGISPIDILNRGLLRGIEEVGKEFKEQEIFLPELIMSVRAYERGFQVIKPLLMDVNYRARGKIVIGTVAGDLHDIGKNVVAAFLHGNGFEVFDLGVDVRRDIFLKKAIELDADIVGMSALLSTTMGEMASFIELLEKEGLRQKIKVIVGGAPLSDEFSSNIGADGYAPDAQAAVELVKSLLNLKTQETLSHENPFSPSLKSRK
jgi:5-methyltetrahydrofolate--homocysteine methyltransferase